MKKRIVKTREELLATPGVEECVCDCCLCEIDGMNFNKKMLRYSGKEESSIGTGRWTWKDWMFKEVDDEAEDTIPAHRFVFLQDQDCHWYQVPVEQQKQFNELIEVGNNWEHPDWEQFEEMRINGGIESISFADPIKIEDE